MAAKRSGLGRGLDSLFDDTSILQTPTPVEKTAPKKVAEKNANEETVTYISLNDIKPNSAQPRKFFNEDALAELAASIKEHGVIQPILVRPAEVGYELVAGERRWRAARLAGLKKIPAIIRELDEKTNTFYALIENMQREDLNAIEEAQGIKEIIDKYGLTQDETAKIVGKSRPYVSNALRLLKLPKEVRELVETGKISQGHARAIAGVQGEKLQLSIAKKVVEEGLSVRQIENYTSLQDTKKTSKSKTKKSKDNETKALEESISEKIGTKVKIEGTAKRGKIILEYFSEDELDNLLEVLKK